MKLSYRKIGKGQPFIILHGLYGAGDNWMQIANKLKDRYSVYLVDLRNHGKSEHSEDFTYLSMANDVYGLIKNEQLNNIVLMGHSMGGRVAMEFAGKHCPYVDKLIIVDIAPPTEAIKKRVQPILFFHRNTVDALLQIPVKAMQKREEADSALARSISSPAIRQFLLKNLKRDADQNFFWQINLSAIDRNLEEIIVGTSVNFKKTECKTLFIKGEKSIYLSIKDTAEINQLFPNNLFEVVKDADHWVHVEKPKEFLEVITNFLSN